MVFSFSGCRKTEKQHAKEDRKTTPKGGLKRADTRFQAAFLSAPNYAVMTV